MASESVLSEKDHPNFGVKLLAIQGRKKTRSNWLGQVNFALAK